MLPTALLRVLPAGLLVLLLLGFGAFPVAHGQVAPATAPAGPGLPAATSQSAPDTAAALHRLYAQRGTPATIR